MAVILEPSLIFAILCQLGEMTLIGPAALHARDCSFILGQSEDR